MTNPRDNAANSEDNKEVAKQQPGGGVNPKLLLIIAGVLVLAGIITLIVFLSRS